MKIVAVISEYNPFHNGHAFHIRKTRELLGDCAVIAVMSGNFVQRGDLAVMDKHARARAAVESPECADLVIELPTPFAMAGAERFAEGAVSLIESLGAVNFLSFGSESGDIEALRKTALLLKDEALYLETGKLLTGGMSYAAARQKAAASADPECAGLLSSPNNILAIEYLKALKDSKIMPVTIKRTGAAHDSRETSSRTSSASRLRSLILSGKTGEALPFMPEASVLTLLREMDCGRAPVRLDTLGLAILSSLRRLAPEDYLTLPDIGGEGLHNRIADAARSAASVRELFDLAKTRRYPHSRIRRVILSAFLKIPDSFMAPTYARVLAFNERGRGVLRRVADSCGLPLIIKPASSRSLTGGARDLWDFECGATDQYALAYPGMPGSCGSEYLKSPFFAK